MAAAVRLFGSLLLGHRVPQCSSSLLLLHRTTHIHALTTTTSITSTTATRSLHQLAPSTLMMTSHPFIHQRYFSKKKKGLPKK